MPSDKAGRETQATEGGQVSEHTKEPWEADGSVVNGLTREPEQHWNGRCHRLGSLYRDADSARAVACVNALAGIPDPAGFVAAAEALKQGACNAIKALSTLHQNCLGVDPAEGYTYRDELIGRLSSHIAAYDKARGR